MSSGILALMSAEPIEPPQLGPRIDRSSGHFTTGYFQTGNIVFGGDEVPPIDPTAKDVELPRHSVLLHHLVSAIADGGAVYLTLFGRRVAALVPADVAESWEDEEPERPPGVGLQEILDDMEARVGPVPAEVAERMDRQWGALVGR